MQLLKGLGAALSAKLRKEASLSHICVNSCSMLHVALQYVKCNM